MFEAVLFSGPLPESFARKNPTISRTLHARSDQTLHELHLALGPAFGLEAGPSYEFHLGRKPSDPKAIQYLAPELASGTVGANRADQTALDSLDLKSGDALTYWLDDGDLWWFRLELTTVEDGLGKGRLPRIAARVGRNPPRQKVVEDVGSQELGGAEAADTACLVGELHLSRGDCGKAIEAFSRAIGLHPTADAYQGRARAYRVLAEQDDERARGLR